jgi:choline-glycine betaine transporter
MVAALPFTRLLILMMVALVRLLRSEVQSAGGNGRQTGGMK